MRGTLGPGAQVKCYPPGGGAGRPAARAMPGPRQRVKGGAPDGRFVGAITRLCSRVDDIWAEGQSVAPREVLICLLNLSSGGSKLAVLLLVIGELVVFATKQISIVSLLSSILWGGMEEGLHFKIRSERFVKSHCEVVLKCIAVFREPFIDLGSFKSTCTHGCWRGVSEAKAFADRNSPRSRSTLLLPSPLDAY